MNNRKIFRLKYFLIILSSTILILSTFAVTTNRYPFFTKKLLNKNIDNLFENQRKNEEKLYYFIETARINLSNPTVELIGIDIDTKQPIILHFTIQGETQERQKVFFAKEMINDLSSYYYDLEIEKQKEIVAINLRNFIISGLQLNSILGYNNIGVCILENISLEIPLKKDISKKISLKPRVLYGYFNRGIQERNHYLYQSLGNNPHNLTISFNCQIVPYKTFL